jgi:hypothetical protein
MPHRLVKCSEKSREFGEDYEVKAISGPMPDGSSWTSTQSEAIADIEAGKEIFYVQLEGTIAFVIVAIHNGVKYLKTQLDPDVPIVLLALPDC